MWADNSGSIHLYDLAAKQDIAISYMHASYPAIYGNKLAWHDESSETPRIAIYDTPTADIYYIPQDVDVYSKPAIYGDRVVWSANGNVYEFDIPTLIQTRIASGTGPDIYGDKIAYAYEDRDGSGIAVYDMATKTTAKVPYTGVLGNPHIYGDKVIFSDSNTRWGNIVMYDLTTKKVKVVTSDSTYSGDPGNPDCGCDTGFHNEIYGDRIVYAKVTDDCLGKAGVYVYNITNEQSTLIYGVGNYVGTTPDISQNTVVWGYRDACGAEASDGDIYAYYLSAQPVDNTPPTTNPVFVTNAESSTPTISWTYNDVEGDPQQQYELEVWTGPNGTGTKMWNTSQSSMYTSVTYTGDSLVGGNTYYVRVKAFDGHNWGEWSETNFIPFGNLISKVEHQISAMAASDPMKYYDAKDASKYMNTIGILHKEEYDAYISNIGIYRSLQSQMLQYALVQAKESDATKVDRDLKLASNYGQNALISFQNANNLYISVLNNGIFVAKEVQTVSLIAFKIVGTAYGLPPGELEALDYIVMAYDDFVIDGKTVDQAGWDLARDLLLKRIITTGSIPIYIHSLIY